LAVVKPCGFAGKNNWLPQKHVGRLKKSLAELKAYGIAGKNRWFN
jgi:hypothetical protein